MLDCRLYRLHILRNTQLRGGGIHKLFFFNTQYWRRHFFNSILNIYISRDKDWSNGSEIKKINKYLHRHNKT